MINLRTALAADIYEGLRVAQAAKVLPETAVELAYVVVTHTDRPEHGDYASPVAMGLSKTLKKSPMEIVTALAEHMPKKEYVGKLEAVAPGFLNIRLNPGWMTARLDDVLEGDLCAACAIGQGQQYNLEFISANPTGPLTFGNVRTAFSVETLAQVLTCAGYNVTREYYINDAGGQIRTLGESVLRRALQHEGEQVEYPEHLYQGEHVIEVAAQILEQWRENEGKEFEIADLESAKIIAQLGAEAARIFLTRIKQVITEDLHIHFDVWTSEQELRERGVVAETLQELRERKVTYMKEGAEYLKTTDYGDSEDRVLIKKDGEYAYIAPDVAYHRDKFERKFDQIFTFVGADHQGHVPKLRAAVAALGYDVQRLHVVAAQWLRFVRGGEIIKFSKRRGVILTPGDLIAEVGYDAARFFMVMHTLTTHMDFDLDLAKERSERNPVYYVQYAYVRLQSILRRAKEQGVITQIGDSVELSSHNALTHTTELDLLRTLYRFPEVVTDVARTYEVQQLPHYALELARAIHVFYRHVPVLATDDAEVMRSRLQLVVAARKVLAQTLDLLGVSKPEIM